MLDERTKNSENVKKKWLEAEYKNKIINANKAKWNNPEYRLKQIEKYTKWSREYWANSDNRIKRSQLIKDRWEGDEEYRNKVIRNTINSCKIKPNKPENILFNIVNTLYPDEFELNINGKLIIGGLVPDLASKFTNQLVEHYGDYWHRNDNPQDRINKFAELGYQCLVVWEHELKNIPEVINKIRKFRATIIEKHFCLKRDNSNPDMVCSIEPNELKELVRFARKVEEIL